MRLALANMRSGQPEAISTGSVGRPVVRAARQPKQRGCRPTGGTPGRNGAMAHGLAVSLLAGIRREVVRVGVAACLKCRGAYARFHTDRKSVSHLSPGSRRFAHAFRKMQGRAIVAQAVPNRTLNTRTGKGLRITRPGKGGQILPLPAISPSIRARTTKLGKRKDTPVKFMVCNFGDLGSIF